MKRNKLLSKIIFKKKSRWALILGVLGFTFGWIILLFSLDFYQKTSNLFSHQDENKEYLMISKEVDKLAVADVKNTFSKAEIDELKSQTFIKKIAPFHTNLYEVWTTGNFMIPVQTDLFFEALDDDMLDVQIEAFNWKEGEDIIPVLLSKDFLNLYNFGYAVARNLPQVPPNLVLLAPPFNAKIYNDKKTKNVQLKIVGFTERVPSILVPLSFMKWANHYFQPQEKEFLPARLMLEVNHIGDPNLLKFLEDKGYSSKKDYLGTAKMVQTAFILTSIVASLGLLFVFLALVIFLSNTKMILLEAGSEIKLLLELGYSPSFLQVFIFFRLLLLLVVNFVSSWLIFGFLHKKAIDFLQERGIDFSYDLDISLFISSGILFVFLLLTSYYFMRSQMKTR